MKNLYLQSISLMKVVTNSESLESLRSALHTKQLALVPTMGALHDGHLKLAQTAKELGYLVLVSIFVNPRQFNNPVDLDKYPRTVEEDKQKLKDAGIDAVYIPKLEDVYSEEIKDVKVDLGTLDHVLEGHYRPGHFDGVVQVLYRFFLCVNPDAVFFGEKDLQQCMVVKKLLNQCFPSITYYQVPTVRESSGLAMSSRNQRLTEEGKKKAAEIYSVLSTLKQQCLLGDFNSEVMINRLKSMEIETEYLAWVYLPDMLPIKDPNQHKYKHQAIVFAGYMEGVRLIDNLVFELA